MKELFGFVELCKAHFFYESVCKEAYDKPRYNAYYAQNGKIVKEISAFCQDGSGAKLPEIVQKSSCGAYGCAGKIFGFL